MTTPDEKLAMLGRTIRSFRREHEISQEALAARAGLHPNQVGRLERGSHDVHATTLIRIVDGLGVSLGEIVRAYEKRLEDQS